MERDRVPPITALDTSVVVSGLLSWHEQHESASAALSELLESGSGIVLPLQTLLEAYAVMTRLPPPHRLNARDAFEILHGTFRNRSRLVGLEGDEGWDLIGDLSDRSITGGTSYDGLVQASARKGGAQRILTFNRAHFDRLGTDDIEIVVPGSRLQ